MGDDEQGVPDDEDGVTFDTRIVPGSEAEVAVSAVGTGYVNAWIDFNADLDWDDPGEHVLIAELLSNETRQLTFDVPSTDDGTVVGWTFARFRFSTLMNPGVDGLAPDGEVEDYYVEVEEGTASISGYKFNDRNINGVWDDGPGAGGPQFELTAPGDLVAFSGQDSDGFFYNNVVENDNLSSGPLDFGFTFEFFGDAYDQFYINNNGNVSLGAPFQPFDPDGFPNPGDVPLVAPYWADVDTRPVNDFGEVRLARGTSAFGRPFVQIDWIDVGYFQTHEDKTNTFTLYVEDNPAGDIVAFVYHDMNWTTGDSSGGFNGFGGQGAEIGFDSGDGENYISLARPADAGGLAALAALGQYVFQFNPASGIPGGLTERGLAGWVIYLDSYNGLANGQLDFVDANGNGVFDFMDADNDGLPDMPGSELALEPVRITLEDDLSTPNVDETGYYEFTQLFRDEYTVAEVPQDDWTQSRPISFFYLDDGSVVEIDAVAGSQLADGQLFHIDDGTNDLSFEFEEAAGGSGWALGNVGVPFDPADTAADVALAIADAINNIAPPLPPLDVTATAAGDEVTLSGTPALFDPGTSPLTFDVVMAPSHGNPDGTYTIGLDSDESVENVDFGNYTLGELNIVDTAIAEGNEGYTEVYVPVVLTRAFGAPVEVNWATGPDPDAEHPATPWLDYIPASGTVYFDEHDVPVPVWETTVLTRNTENDYDYRVWGNYIVWEGYDGIDWEIYFYDGNEDRIFQLTDNNTDDRFASVYGQNVVWAGHDGNDYEVYLFDYAAYRAAGSPANTAPYTRRLTFNAYDDKDPQPSDEAVVWWGYDTNSPHDIEIFYYNFAAAAANPAYQPQNISNNNYDDYDPQISGAMVTWYASDGIDNEIYLYDGTQRVQVTSNGFNDRRPDISGSIVVWEGYDGQDYEIFAFDYATGNTRQITNNTTNDKTPQVSGDNIVWSGFDGLDWEIYYTNFRGGGSGRNISNNSAFDEQPRIEGNRVVWHQFDGSDWEVYFYDLTGEHGPSNVSNNDAFDWYPQVSDELIVWRSYDGEDYEIVIAREGEPEVVKMAGPILIVGERLIEYDETFAVNLSGAVFAEIGDDQAIVEILNDDGALDYGDAPNDPYNLDDPLYPTLLASNGARHVTVPGYYLGARVDAEGDGRPDDQALGDDNYLSDDEDGVALPSQLRQGDLVTITVTASAPGKLDAWVDFDANGDWEDAFDQIFADQPLVTGSNTLEFRVPGAAEVGTTFARFRFSSEGGLAFTGSAMDGEVEDYTVNIVPATTTIGSTLIVRGTPFDDQFEFTSGEVYKVTINGVLSQYHAADIDYVTFSGLSGRDTVVINGDAQNDALQIWATAARLDTDGLRLDVSGAEAITATGGGGDDVLSFYDSSANDTFVGKPGGGWMINDDVYHYASDFDTVSVYAKTYQGDSDTAKIYDSPGNDTFATAPNQFWLLGSGFSLWGEGFSGISGYATAGYDTAKMYDSGQDDVYIASPVEAVMSGPGFYNRAKGYEEVHGYANAGKDVAYLNDDAQGSDVFYANSWQAAMYGTGYYNRGKYFEEVYATARGGPLDEAKLYDSPGDDVFFARETTAVLYGDGFWNQANGFDGAHAYAWGGGHDEAKFYDSPYDDHLLATPTFTAFWGPNYYNRAKFFEATHTYATQGGVDTAVFEGSEGDDVLRATEADTAMWCVGHYYNRAKYFERISANGKSLGGNDQALLFDTALADLFEADGNEARLTNANLDLRVADFSYVKATTSETYNDSRKVLSHVFALEFEGYWKDV